LNKFDFFDSKLLGKTTILGQKNKAECTRSKLAVGDATLNVLIGELNGIMVHGCASHHIEKLGSIDLYLGINPWWAILPAKRGAIHRSLPINDLRNILIVRSTTDWSVYTS
jgi:hypothetical protein